MQKKLFFLILLLSFTQISCNVFSSLDSPSSDEQKLSAARACFDEGDIECALDLYEELASDFNDIRHTEDAFAKLEKAGVGMRSFMTAFGGGGNAGKSITRLVNLLISDASESKRLAIHGAFSKVHKISDPFLRGLVRFVSSAALIAELLAETASLQGSYELTTADLANDASTCKETTDTGCATETTCGPPTNNALIQGDAVDLETTSPSGDSPTFAMLHASVQQVIKALSGELSAVGNFQSSITDLGAVLELQGNPTTILVERCYRYLLLDKGLGSS